jgi:N-acetylmuramoyl-L-alanine amidase
MKSANMMRKIDYIVIHCTATPQTARIDSIKNYWRNNLGWNRVGYHFIIEAHGNVVQLSDIKDVTNGVAGFNRNSIHIAYIGGIDSKGRPLDNRTDAQKRSLLNTIRKVRAEVVMAQRFFPIIQGHNDFPNVKKACPSFNAKKEYENI